MIERISNQMLVVRPAHGRTQPKKNVSIKVGNDNPKPAEELYNPDLADKINSSRQSIRDELNLLKDLSNRPNVEKGERDGSGGDGETSSYSSVKKSLMRISSLLYQVASVAGGDAESIERMQKRLVDEFREYEGKVAKVDFEGVDADKLNISAKVDLDKLTASNAADAQKTVEEAERALTQTSRTARTEKSDKQSATEAALSTAEQNLAAAESAFYPEEIVDRARSVAGTLRGQMQGVAQAQGKVVPEDVLKLLADA